MPEPLTPEYARGYSDGVRDGRRQEARLAARTRPSEAGLREALGGLVNAVIAMKRAIPPATTLGDPWKAFLARTGDVNMWLDHAEAALAATPPEEPSLDAAWREVEAALPEGWNWEDITRLRGDSEGEWSACARNDTGEGRYRWCGIGPTPADALRALAARLATEAPS
jgi:hypothetical protein